MTKQIFQVQDSTNDETPHLFEIFDCASTTVVEGYTDMTHEEAVKTCEQLNAEVVE